MRRQAEDVEARDQGVEVGPETREDHALEDSERIRTLLARLDLPPLPHNDEAFRPESLLALLARDKKATEEGLAWVLAERLGCGRIERIPSSEIAAELDRFLAIL